MTSSFIATWIGNIGHPLLLTAGTLSMLAISYFVGLAFYNIFLHPLHAYPGPKLWAANRFMDNYHAFYGTLNARMVDLHMQYGEVVRSAPDTLSYATSQAWKDIYAHHQGQEDFRKDPLRQQVPPNGIPNILGANRENHARYRRLFSHAFSEKGMREQEPLIKQYVDLLVSRLQQAAKLDKSQDMLSWYNRTTFDLIGDLAFGESFGNLREETIHPWIAAVYGNLKFIIIGGLFRRYGLTSLLPYFIPKSLVQKRIDNYKYTQDKIDRRIAFGAERGDFWDKIMIKSDNDNASGQGMSKGEMLNNASTMVLAGSETTATLLSGATYLLTTHPEKLRKLVREIRTTFASTEEITLYSVARLKYMLAVLDESMRVYPPVPLAGPRIVPKGGAAVAGKYVPEDTVVQVLQQPANLLPSNFHRAAEFIPERWLEDRDAQFDNDDREVLQPFSVGPRNCIGRNLAYAEMRLILAKVLYHFDLELDERTGDWTNQKVFGLWEKPPLWMNVAAVA